MTTPENTSGVVRRAASGGGRFETLASYVRARRVGPFIYVSGTTAIEPSGALHSPYDMYAQTHYALDRIERALGDVGGRLSDVVRVRAYMADNSGAGDFARAHGERFAEIEPAMTAVQAVLSYDGMMIEIDVDAIVAAELAQ